MSETMTQEQVSEVNSNPLADAIWGDAPPATATVETTQAVETTTTQEAVTEKTEVAEQVNPNEYLKQNLGYDDWETAKSEIAELKKLKEQKPEQFKFANEQSERLFNAMLSGKEDEIFEVISKKRQLERVERLDVSNAKEAAELIRTSLRLKYSDLESSEIEDMFSEQYQKYEKPKQSFDETDEEYEQKVAAWQFRNDAVDKKIIRDAKIAKPDILKLKNEIVYPEIPAKGSQTNTEPSQEEIANFVKVKDSFLQSADSVMKNFNGFRATVKDKDVEIPVSYDFSEGEKSQLKKAVTDFAENGLNANAIFAPRWLNEDGSINSEKLVKDLSKILLDEEKINQKFVNDAANKRLEAYLKEKKQVTVTPTTSTATFNPGGESEKSKALQEHFWNS